jgi:hypothetical protein
LSVRKNLRPIEIMEATIKKDNDKKCSPCV